MATRTTGTIPPWLEGNFLQNGPGKFYFGANDVFQHLFDGSALVQKYIGEKSKSNDTFMHVSCYIKFVSFAVRNGQVSYQCRFLRTNSFKNNMAAGRITGAEFGTNPNSSELKNSSSSKAKTSTLASRMSKLATGVSTLQLCTVT